MLSGPFRVTSKRSRGCAVAALFLAVCALALSIAVGVRRLGRRPPRQGVNSASTSVTAAPTTRQHFAIVVSASDQERALVEIEDNAVIDVETLGNVDELDIHVELVQPPVVNYVEFSHNGDYNVSRAYAAPYSICDGLTRGLCLDLFVVGNHTIVATPFSLDGEPAGRSLVVSYAVITAGSGSEQDLASSAAPKSEDSVQALPRSCGTPLLVGDWEWGDITYPLDVAEAQGAKIGDDLLIVGGFIGGYENTTKKVFARNLTDDSAEWRPMDDLPSFLGITHAAYAVVGKMAFFCGGYRGGNIGPATDLCLRYNHTAPIGRQWQLIRPLPEARAGGGMVYDASQNVLLFSAGATRPQPGVSHAFDHANSWMYNLSDPLQGWTNRTDIPFFGNHVGFVTALDEYDRQRHFFVGGQEGEKEATGNTKANYEWIAAHDTWVARQSMPISRGHAASATKAYGCGFLVAGGTTNEHGMTADISFYDIPSDSWQTIGSLPAAVNTAVCEFGGGYLYCETGWTDGPFSVRRKIVLSLLRKKKTGSDP